MLTSLTDLYILAVTQLERKMDLCIECKKRPILIKKRKLCSACYQRIYQNRKVIGKDHKFTFYTAADKAHESEILFIKNYFKHDNWIFHPASFRLNGTTYSPDFYDEHRNVFIEVSGSRQAYFQNKAKYQQFRETFPKINFEIRNPDGEIIDENKPINSQI